MKKFIYVKIFIIVLFSVFMLCSCTEISEPEASVPAAATAVTEAAYPVEAGNLIFNSSPKTIGSLSPAVTEIIFELGFGDRLVCRSSYCDYPEEAKDIPHAGSAANPDIDKLIGYSPDLLITQSPIANKDIKRLNESGITLLTLPAPSSLTELFENYRIISNILSGSIDGDRLAQNALSEFKTALTEADNSCESLVLIMNVSEDGFSVGTGDSFAGDYISAFGKNIAEEYTEFSMTAEELISADPQVIFLAHPLESHDIPAEVSSQLSAFSEGHVFVIDASLTERPTSRLAGLTRSVSETVRADTGGAASDTKSAEVSEETEEKSSEVSDDSPQA